MNDKGLFKSLFRLANIHSLTYAPKLFLIFKRLSFFSCYTEVSVLILNETMEQFGLCHTDQSEPYIHASQLEPYIHASQSEPYIHASQSESSIHASQSEPSIHASHSEPSIHASQS